MEFYLSFRSTKYFLFLEIFSKNEQKSLHLRSLKRSEAYSLWSLIFSQTSEIRIGVAKKITPSNKVYIFVLRTNKHFFSRLIAYVQLGSIRRNHRPAAGETKLLLCVHRNDFFLENVEKKSYIYKQFLHILKKIYPGRYGETTTMDDEISKESRLCLFPG